MDLDSWHGTTILGVKKGGRTVIAGDGQVSMGNTVMKPNAKKVRRIGENGAKIWSDGETICSKITAELGADAPFKRFG